MTLQLVGTDDFTTNPPAHDVIASAGWIAALTQVASAIRSTKLVVVTGGQGVGKSTLLRCLSESLRRTGQSVIMLEPDAPSPKAGVVVLIDDADRFGKKALSALLRRSCGCVVVAPADLISRLAVRPTQSEVVTIAGIGSIEVTSFVAKSLRAAGESSDLVSRDAVAALDEHCGGSPGKILATLRLAIFLARMELGDTVLSRHITDAVSVDDRVRLPDLDPAEPAVGAGPSAGPGPWVRVSSRVSENPGWLAICAIACALAISTAFFATRSVHIDRPLLNGAALPRPRIEAASPGKAPQAIAVATATPPANSATIPLAEPPLPPVDKMHVTIFVPEGEKLALDRAAAMASALREKGYEVDEPKSSRVRKDALELHYFFVDDRSAANALAAALDEEPGLAQLVDAAGDDRARPAAAEVWLPAIHLNRRRGQHH